MGCLFFDSPLVVCHIFAADLCQRGSHLHHQWCRSLHVLPRSCRSQPLGILASEFVNASIVKQVCLQSKSDRSAKAKACPNVLESAEHVCGLTSLVH